MFPFLGAPPARTKEGAHKGCPYALMLSPATATTPPRSRILAAIRCFPESAP